MKDKEQERFEILRQLALSGSRGDEMSRVARVALEQAAALVHLDAAALYFWCGDFQLVQEPVTLADSDELRLKLTELETDLFSRLRKEKNLLAAYLTFDEEPPLHSFTLPLRYRGRTYGAVIGLQRGEKTVVSEDQFLEALSSAATLTFIADRLARADIPITRVIELERLALIAEIVEDVNDKVNNPLTPITGYVSQLLGEKEKHNFDSEVIRKLELIAASAERIQRFTTDLRRWTPPGLGNYDWIDTILCYLVDNERSRTAMPPPTNDVDDEDEIASGED